MSSHREKRGEKRATTQVEANQAGGLGLGEKHARKGALKQGRDRQGGGGGAAGGGGGHKGADSRHNVGGHRR
jgi:hypothetical protein